MSDVLKINRCSDTAAAHTACRVADYLAGEETTQGSSSYHGPGCLGHRRVYRWGESGTFGQKRSDLNPTLAVVWRAETMTLGSSLPRWRVAAQTLRKDDGFNNYRV